MLLLFPNGGREMHQPAASKPRRNKYIHIFESHNLHQEDCATHELNFLEGKHTRLDI